MAEGARLPQCARLLSEPDRERAISLDKSMRSSVATEGNDSCNPGGQYGPGTIGLPSLKRLERNRLRS